MSRIEDLIATLCPDGVEFKPLGEIGTLVRGSGMPKADFTEEGVGAIHYGQVYTRFGTWADHTISFVPSEKATRLAKVDPGDLIITNTSENVEDVCKAVAWLGEDQIVTGGHATVLKHNEDPKFLAYYMQTEEFSIAKRKFVTGTKVQDVSANNLARIKVPIPSLVIQREIVKILDQMEALEVELESELQLRARQYDLYRDRLTCYGEDDVRWATFGEVATILRGGSPRPIQSFLTDDVDGIHWVKIGDVPANGKYVTRTAQRIRQEGAAKSRAVAPGDFVLSNSMSFGRPYIMKIDGCIHDGWLAIKDFDDSFDRDFLYHLLRSKPVYREMSMRAGGGTVKNLNVDIVKALRLPVPPLSEQQRVAEILDKFDLLLNDPAYGLPAEIEARRQQFEHYRDRLMTFKEKEAVA